MNMTDESEVLCPELYYKLKKIFNKVLVSNKGVAMVERTASDGSSSLLVSGEHYRVCCPWCNDSRFRLYINHRWFENRFMASCFNETACTKGEAGRSRLDQLHVWLFGTTAKMSLPVRQVKLSDSEAAHLLEFKPPQGCVALSDLSDDHEALVYLRGRGYDTKRLERYLGLGWITDQGIPALRDRIYIPIYQGAKLMGYQARVAGTGKLKTRQKYINPIGMRKSTLLYNLDNAVNQGCLVVCEGPADVWSVGPAGIAIFGSDCSHSQLSSIGKHFNGKPIAVALDADASDKANQLVAKIQQTVPRSLVVKIEMEGDEDPGTLRLELWRRFHNKISASGMEIPKVIMEWPPSYE